MIHVNICQPKKLGKLRSATYKSGKTECTWGYPPLHPSQEYYISARQKKPKKPKQISFRTQFEQRRHAHVVSGKHHVPKRGDPRSLRPLPPSPQQDLRED